MVSDIPCNQLTLIIIDSEKYGSIHKQWQECINNDEKAEIE